MLDASVLFSPINQTGNAANLQQTLPAPNSQDVMRFEHIMNQGLEGDISANPALLDKPDVPLLQLQASPDAQNVDFKQAAVNTISDLDSSYHQMLSQFSTMPNFSQFMSEKLTKVETNEMRTYPEVGSANSSANSMDKTVKNTQEYMTAALDYNSNLSRWSMNANMWMSKFTLISSAVNQVSQGFKTLFRTGG